jgi:prephenate dehydrogenase
VLGVGLLGGSLGLALRSRRLATEVWGVVRQDRVIAEAEAAGVVDRATTQLAEAVRDADVVVLCLPVGAMPAMAEAIRDHLKPGAVVTDVGSVKESVVTRLEPIIEAAGGWFVGSHPMAGSEKTGFGAARADLFDRAVCVVTPTSRSYSPAVAMVEDLWRSIGSTVLSLSPGQHDELVSRASHLPHVLAAGLVNYVLSPAHAPTGNRLCATGFRDTTRIASSSPELWRDIALANRQHLGRALGVLIADLEEFQRALQDQDTRAVGDFFETAKRRRDAWLAAMNTATSD